MKSALALTILLATPVALGSADDLAITTTSPLYNGTVDVPYVFLRFQASGGAGGYTWDAPGSALPPGLTLDSSGVLAGVPTTTGGNAFSVRVTDSQGNQSSGAFTLNVYLSDNTYCNPGNVPIAPNGGMDGPAQLPQSCFFTDLSATPSPGSVIAVAEGQSLQSALNAASCGDVIALQAGASFTGNNVVFPAKTCDDGHWITVRSSTPDTLLPPEGARMTPCWAGVGSLRGRPPYNCPPDGVPATSLLAQIVLTSNAKLSIPGDHYRLIGLEITRAAGGGPVSVYVSTPGGAQLIFDRVWIHGTAMDESTHGIAVSDAHHVALVDSYMDDFHCTAVTGTCTDAQTFSGANDSTDGVAGTFKVVDNFEEASGENILFGGGRSVDVPGDIEVRRNYLFKPMTWNPDDPTFVGTAFIVKNHYEMKNGARALIEGNIMENVWGGFSQVGAHVLLTPKNQAAGTESICPICAVTDVTLRYNHLISGAQGFQIADGANDNGAFAFAGNSISVHDNLVENLEYPTCHACGTYYNQVATGTGAPSSDILHDLTINHVTMVVAASAEGTAAHSSGFLTLGGPVGPVMSNIVFENSIVSAGYYGPWSTGGTTNCAFGQNSPLAKFDACWDSYTFSGNVIAGGTTIRGQMVIWPDGNQFPLNQGAIGYVSFSGGGGGDYHLDPTSPYKGTANDGTDPGANIDLVNQHTYGVR